jgi:hypothetical protein
MQNLISKNDVRKTRRVKVFSCVLLLLAGVLLSACSSETSITSEISTYYKSIQDFLSGVNKFFSAMYYVTSLVGFKPIALLIAVFILSSGLSSIGIPKGRAAFFTSLVIADTIWILWKYSFDSPAEEYWTIVKSTFVLLIPFLFLLILKKLAPVLIAFLKKLRPRSRGHEVKFTRREINSLSRQLLEKNVELHNQIQTNMDEDETATGINSETKKRITEIKKLLDLLEKKNTLKKRETANESPGKIE